MVAFFYLNKPIKRKIPKGRVSRKHHYIMIFPTDLLSNPRKCFGLPYTNFFDSFLEDCVKRMSKSPYAFKLHDEGQFEIMTACLN
jgi:hypothetical protein